MRRLVLIASVVLAAIGVCVRAAQTPEQTNTLLVDARQALGGEQSLAAIKSFTIKASIKGADGPQAQLGWVKIACELPDKFVQTEDRVRVLGTEPKYFQYVHDSAVAGFNDGKLIYEHHPEFSPYSEPGSAYAYGTYGQLSLLRRPSESVQMAVSEARQNFARITMGLLSASFSGAPLQFTPVGGDPSALNVVGSGAEVTMRFDPQTHLPQAFGHVTYTNYRAVNGIKVPFTLLWTTHDAEGAHVEEWDVREIRLNPVIAPSVFAPRIN